VWPFDCAVAAEGLRRCGQAEAAVTLALALVDACDRFGHRLPELFAGFDRDGADVPSPYPGANRPQAFSAGAPLMVVRTLLGLDVVEGTLVADPIGGDRVGHLALRGMWATGRRQDAPPAAWPPSAAE
jgi:glycogen debranching enzyme